MNVYPEYESYLRDESRLPGRAERIAFPRTPEELRQGILQCREAGETLTVQGTRTGMVGGAVPEGGWILNLSCLNRMGPVDGENRIRVQAGVILEDLQRQAAARGLFYPPSPTEEGASLGGMFATGAAGPNRYFYGPSSRYVTALTWITPEGEIRELRRGEAVARDRALSLPDGSRVPAGTGTDLIDWLSGSEGRLGIAAELELQLLPMPEEQWGLVFFFQDQARALAFGESLRLSPVPGLTAGEYFDRGALELLRSHGDHPLLKDLPQLPKGAAGAIACELASQKDLTESLMDLLERFDGQGGREEDSWAESGAAGVQKLRRLRHAVPAILNELGTGPRLEGDFQGPGDQGILWAKTFGTMLGDLKGAVYGHLLDNGLRVALPENSEACRSCLLRMARFAADRGGNVAGEYGMGKTKRALAELLPEEACRRPGELTGSRVRP